MNGTAFIATRGPRATAVLVALACLAACSDALEVRYRGRMHITPEPLTVVLPLLGGERARGVVADEEGALQILPFDGGEPCELGRVRALASYRVSGDYRLGLRVDHEDGSDRVRFVDADCEPHLAPVRDAGPTALVDGHVVAEVAGALVAFDPWDDEQTTISDEVTELGSLALDRRGRSVGLWILEGEDLVIRSFDGEVLQEVAGGVVDIDIARSGDDELIYANDDGIFMVRADASNPVRLHDPGCRLRSHLVLKNRGLVRHVSALSPCDQGTLVTIDEARSDAPVRVEHARAVRSFWHRSVRSEGDAQVWTFYVTEVGDVRRSFVARPDGEAVELPISLPSRPTLWPWHDGDFASGHGAWLIVDADGELGLWDAEQGRRVLAEAVAQVALSVSGWLVHHDLADGLGTVSAILPDATLETLALDAPEGGLFEVAGTGPRAGAISSHPPMVGTLVHDLSQAAGRLSSLGEAPGSLTTLAERIDPRSLRTFRLRLRGSDLAAETEPVGALGYLRSYDDETETGELAIRLDDGRSFVIDEGVGSFRPSDSQLRPGMLYSIARGSRRGIWFAPQ